MTGTRGTHVRRATGAGTAVVLLAGLLSGTAAAAAPGAGSAERGAPTLPRETARGVVVDLADGDRFQVAVARDLRTVWGRRYDAATGSWGERTVVLRRKHLFCGDVDARAGGTSVAVIAECDRYGYAEDQAPTHSQALWSDDLVTWRTHRLQGEAYQEPGISPDGRSAVWPQYQGYLTLTPAEGFVARDIALPGQEYTETATITDEGRVSVLYGASDNHGSCRLAVASRLGDEPAVRQDLDGADACSDSSLVNVDALTALFGDPTSPAYVTQISRPDQASPWAVTAVAPAEAPGLVRDRGRGAATTLFAASPGLTLQAVGSADRHQFTAQAYDPVEQRWLQPRPIARTESRCTWGDNFIEEPLGVLALRLDCGRRARVLISTDTEVWHDVPLGRTPLGVSPDRRYVSATNRSRTLVYSRERGVVRLPLPSRARCDVVQPVSPDAALRLTSTRRNGWPSVLQESTASGWRRTGAAVPRPRVGRDTCRRAEVEVFEDPVSYGFSGRRRAASLSVVRRGDGWTVRRTRY